MSFFSMLKYNARLALRRNWAKAVFAALLPALLGLVLGLVQQLVLQVFVLGPVVSGPSMAPSSAGQTWALVRYAATVTPLELGLTLGFTLLSALVLSPVTLGTVYWFWSLTQGKAQPISSVFRFFESWRQYRRALWFELTLTLRCLFWAVVFFLLPTGLFALSYHLLGLYGAGRGSRAMATMATMGATFSVILSVLCLFLYVAYMNKYAVAAYLLCEDDNLSVSRAIKASVAYTKGFRFNLIWFHLSFIGWMLLSALLVFLPALYLTPYLNTSRAMYARYVIEKNRAAPPSPTKEFIVEEPQEAAAQPEEEEFPVFGTPELPQPPADSGPWPSLSDEPESTGGYSDYDSH